MLKYTLKDYMNNPSGKGSTVIPNRQIIIEDFKKRYEKIKEHHKFDTEIYRNKDDYFFHILVPSEDKDKEITYDVIIQFTMLDEDFKNDININRYYVKFFSNCPSFTFTYAYVYNTNNIIVDGFETKYRDEVILNEPNTRNPNQIVSFEKSIYFACLHILSNTTYLNKLYLNSHAKSLNINSLIKRVRTTDKILVEYNKIKKNKEKYKEVQTKRTLNSKGINKKPTTSNKIKPTSKIKAKNKITAKTSTIRKNK